MTLPTTNISTNLVRNELNETINNVGGLCVSPNVNLWAKRKPVRDSRISVPPAEVGVAFGTYGISIPAYSGDDTLVTTYQKPRGFSFSEPYRLGDFRGYKHTAFAPILLPPAPPELKKREHIISAIATIPGGDDISIVDIAGNLRIGVFVYKAGSGLIGSASAQNAGDASVDIDLTGLNYSSVDVKFCLTDYYKPWGLSGMTALFEIPRKDSTQNKNWINIPLTTYTPPTQIKKFSIIYDLKKDRIEARVESNTYTGLVTIAVIPRTSGLRSIIFDETIASTGIKYTFYEPAAGKIVEGEWYDCYLRNSNNVNIAETSFVAFQPI